MQRKEDGAEDVKESSHDAGDDGTMPGTPRPRCSLFSDKKVEKFRTDLRKWADQNDAGAYFRLVELLLQDKVQEAVFEWSSRRLTQLGFPPEDASIPWEGAMERGVDPVALANLWGRWGDKADPEIWLRLKLKGKISDYLRSRGHQPPPEEPLERFNPDTGQWEPIEVADLDMPESIVICREQARVVREAVDCLPEHLRTVVNLYHFEGLNQSEVGQMIGATRRTVINRLQSANEELRRLLGPSLCGKMEVC